MKAELLKALQKKAPEEIKAVEKWASDLEAKNLAVLGEDQCFKLTDSKGEIRAFKSDVRLSEAEGTLVPAFGGGPMTVSAYGYTKLQEAAGAVCMNAPTLFFEGQQVNNPYVILHPETKRTLKVVCRSIAFRYTNKGIPQVSDRIAVLDIPAYRMTVLMAKAKKFPQCFKLLPVGLEPSVISDNETWAKYQFDESTNLWVETSHNEVLDFYKQIVNLEKKAVETCQTFAQRNALKHLMGLSKVPQNAKTWNVPVVCWRPLSGSIIKWDAAQYALAQDTMGAIAESRQLDSGSIETTAIEVGSDDIDPENTEAQETIEEEAPPETEPEGPPPATPDNEKPVRKTENKKPEKQSGIHKQLEATKQAMPEYYAAAVGNLQIDDTLLTNKEVKAIMTEINRLVDKDNLE